MLRVKSASVKALLSEDASDGKRKVRKMIIWGFEILYFFVFGELNVRKKIYLKI